MTEVLYTLKAFFVGRTKSEIKIFLAKNCFRKTGEFKVGFPSIPDLLNIYLGYTIDLEAKKLCQRYGLIYSRYADDLFFSSNTPITRGIRGKVRKIIQSVNLKPNHHDSKVVDFKKGPVVINGVGIALGRTFCPRRKTDKLRGLLWKYKKTKDPELKKKIHGLYGYFCSVTNMDSLNKTERKIVTLYKRVIT